MPINASPHYLAAEKEYFKAKTPEERLEKLKKMLSLAPKHKGAGNLLDTEGIISSDLQKDLDRLNDAKIPVDIVFEQGVDVLNLN